MSGGATSASIAVKGNIAPPAKATWFKIVSVPCANGEDTPTVLPWKFSGPFDQNTTDHMHQIRKIAAEGNYRKDAQSEDWIGRTVAEVVGLDPDDETDRKQIKSVLKLWFNNGVLATEERKDERRRLKQFVVPGNWQKEAAPPCD